jgi:hypothetical protein
MAKTKGPGLADYAVHLTGHSRPLKIRAASLITAGEWLFLRDAAGGILFAAPRESVRYVKHLEPGEAIPEPAPAPPAETPPLFTAIIEPIGVDPPPPPEVALPDPEPSVAVRVEEIPGAEATTAAVDARGRKLGSGGRFS